MSSRAEKRPQKMKDKRAARKPENFTAVRGREARKRLLARVADLEQAFVRLFRSADTLVNSTQILAAVAQITAKKALGQELDEEEVGALKEFLGEKESSEEGLSDGDERPRPDVEISASDAGEGVQADGQSTDAFIL